MLARLLLVVVVASCCSLVVDATPRNRMLPDSDYDVTGRPTIICCTLLGLTWATIVAIAVTRYIRARKKEAEEQEKELEVVRESDAFTTIAVRAPRQRAAGEKVAVGRPSRRIADADVRL